MKRKFGSKNGSLRFLVLGSKSYLFFTGYTSNKCMFQNGIACERSYFIETGKLTFHRFSRFYTNNFGKLPQNFWSQSITKRFPSKLSYIPWSIHRACNCPPISAWLQRHHWLQVTISVFPILLSLHRGMPKEEEISFGRQRRDCKF